MRQTNFAKRTSAFTLIEMLVVIAIIGLLSALLFPVLTKAKVRAQALQCLNNGRQMTIAWHLYAVSSSDLLVYNNRMGHSGGWVDGSMTWNSSPDDTNVTLLANSLLGPYTFGNLGVYHCPADRSIGAGMNAARVRSFSMNAFVGNQGPGVKPLASTNTQFVKLGDFHDPAMVYVFLDEHPDSINDGFFVGQGDVRNQWTDLPASYHDGAAGLSFADGHSEIHKWMDPITLLPIAKKDRQNLPMPVPPDQTHDTTWAWQRMTFPK
jgi:prepilin-type N-terminal cleavage/methylation domain-containing protein/prepilin-type processing-associated H-X9-DG protein